MVQNFSRYHYYLLTFVGQGDICWTRGLLSDKGTFVGQGDILSDKGTFCWTKGHFVGQGDIMLYKGRSLSDKGTFSLKSLFGLLWAGGGMWRH